MNLQHIIPLSSMIERAERVARSTVAKAPLTRPQIDLIVQASLLAALQTCMVEDGETVEVILN